MTRLLFRAVIKRPAGSCAYDKNCATHFGYSTTVVVHAHKITVTGPYDNNERKSENFLYDVFAGLFFGGGGGLLKTVFFVRKYNNIIIVEMFAFGRAESNAGNVRTERRGIARVFVYIGVNLFGTRIVSAIGLPLRTGKFRCTVKRLE